MAYLPPTAINHKTISDARDAIVAAAKTLAEKYGRMISAKAANISKGDVESAQSAFYTAKGVLRDAIRKHVIVNSKSSDTAKEDAIMREALRVLRSLGLLEESDLKPLREGALGAQKETASDDPVQREHDRVIVWGTAARLGTLHEHIM
jgi:hypothetical protein